MVMAPPGWLAGVFRVFLHHNAAGLFLLSALDSSFLTLPLANDMGVIVLVSLHHQQWLLLVVAATMGSFTGCLVMYALGRQGGERLIRAHMTPQQFQRMHASISRKGPVLLAVPALIPPPFPFTAFVLGAGALEVPGRPFLLALTGMRLIRFLAEGLAALYFGRGIAGWLDTRSFEITIEALVVIALLASGWSIYRLVRAARRAGSGAGA